MKPFGTIYPPCDEFCHCTRSVTTHHSRVLQRFFWPKTPPARWALYYITASLRSIIQARVAILHLPHHLLSFFHSLILAFFIILCINEITYKLFYEIWPCLHSLWQSLPRVCLSWRVNLALVIVQYWSAVLNLANMNSSREFFFLLIIIDFINK